MANEEWVRPKRRLGATTVPKGTQVKRSSKPVFRGLYGAFVSLVETCEARDLEKGSAPQIERLVDSKLAHGIEVGIDDQASGQILCRPDGEHVTVEFWAPFLADESAFQ